MKFSPAILLENGVHFVFRADASFEMGVGHVMRVLTYAEELSEAGFRTFFVGKIGGIDWLIEKIKGIANLHWVEENEDFHPNPELSVLFIDSYLIGVNDPFLDRSKWLAVVSIVDDKTPGYLASYYVNPGPLAGWVRPNGAPDARTFAGVEYIPFRMSFRKILTGKIKNHGPAQILVLGGGTDLHNFGEKIALILSSIPGSFNVDIFSNFQGKNLKDDRIQIREIGLDLEKCLKSADFVFTTAGTTSWEVLALNIPCAVALTVENQRSNYDYFKRNNMAGTIGEFKDGKWILDLKAIELEISRVLTNQPTRDSTKNSPDLLGAERFLSVLLKELAEKI